MPAGRRGHAQVGVGVLLLGELDAPLDFANGIQIFGHAIAIVRAQAALQTPHLAGDGVENAALLLDAFQPLGGGRAVAEQAVEHHARIDLHGQRRGGRAPGNRVHVGATEADVAGADQAAVILGGQFERRQRRFLADLLRGDLIDGDAGVNVGAIGALGVDAVQEHRRGARVVAAVIAGSGGRGHLVRQIADHHHLVLERLQRGERAGKLERAFLGGRPVGHHAAVRDEAQPEPDLRVGGGLRQRRLGRNHGIEQRQRHRHAHAAQKRPARKVLLGDAASLGLFSLDLHLERRALHDAQQPATKNGSPVLSRPARSCAPRACRNIRRRGPERRSAASRSSRPRRLPDGWRSIWRSADGPVDLRAVEQRARRIDACAVLVRPPASDARRSFRARSRSGPSPCGSRRRPDWRDAAPCARAATAACRRRRFLQRRNIRRRRRRRHAQKIRQNPLAALHRRGAVRHRTSRSECCPGPSSPRRASSVDRHAAELASVDVRECRSAAPAAR